MKTAAALLAAVTLIASGLARGDRHGYNDIVELRVESPAIIVEHHHDWHSAESGETYSYLKATLRSTGAELFRQPVPALTYLWISPDSRYIVGLSHVMLRNPYQIVVYDWNGKRLFQDDLTGHPKVRRTVTNFVYWYDEPTPKIVLKESPARVSLTISDEEGMPRIFRFPPTVPARPIPPVPPVPPRTAASDKPVLIYEFYELHPPGRKLLSSGTMEYAAKDIIVGEEGEQRGVHFAQKELHVVAGFAVGASIYREKDLTGFGMWLKDRNGDVGQFGRGGFSWDWFNRESGDVYRKLQGGGRVRVTFVPSAEYQEIRSIEVLEDITLRLKDQSVFSMPSREDTHNMVLRRGSVLDFGP